MSRLDNLYKKALQNSRDKHSRELLAQSVEFMGIWSTVMTYCYKRGIEVLERPAEREEVLREACCACGYKEQADEFLKWYLDEDNDTLFIIKDYGDGDLEFGG